ncbi:flippase [uncultured Allomuricauda sp.]|uniref:flippase n=1 Tax=Flagellimonas sp. W118 TaxID=3410791 RepID=UPI0026236FBD|nr:flippase [uncultured Allomuricauda sp.]
MSVGSNKKEILIKGAGVFLIRILGYGLGFMFIWVVANKFGPKIQGIFSISFLFLSIGTMVAKLGVETALVKWVASISSLRLKKKVYLKSLQVVLISSLIVCAGIYLLAPLISKMYSKPDIESSIKIAALAIPFLSIIDVTGSYFKGQKKIIIFGLYFHFAKFLAPLLTILTFYILSTQLLEAPILSYLLGLSLVAIVIVTHVLFVLRKFGNQSTDLYKTAYIISESYPMMISSAIVMIMGWSDIFILGFYESEEMIGIYSTAIKIATAVSFVYNAVATIATPKIAAFYKDKNHKQLSETISFSSKIIFLFSFPIFLILFCFPTSFLGFFGDEYVLGENVLRILLIAQFTNIVTGPVGPIFQMTGNQKKLQHYITISLAINILFSVALVNFLGVVGVAIGSALGMMVWNIMGSKYIKKKLKLKTYYNFK